MCMSICMYNLNINKYVYKIVYNYTHIYNAYEISFL